MQKLSARSVLVFLALAAAAGPATAGPKRAYVWSRVYEGAVQYGVPDTDDRALRIDCVRGRLSIGGPSDSDAPEGAAVPVVFRGEGFSERRTARVFECDGVCFDAVMKPEDRTIATLIRGKPVTVVHAGQTWTVSGVGAMEVLRPLLTACGVRAAR